MNKQIALLLLLLLALCACTPDDDNQVRFNPTIEVDEECAGLPNNTFITSENLQKSDENDIQILTPYRVSFLLDGRVVWNYEDNVSYIGTFTCESGEVSATFEDGTRREFIGRFDSGSGTIIIEEFTYFVATDV